VNVLTDGASVTGLLDFESVRLADPLFLSLAALCALSPDGRPTGAGIRAFRNAGAVRRPLGLPDDLVG
jgi:aminoglycoside phosphotransferase (APT) family kinase protein